MEEFRINESKFAKKLKISRNTVNEVMKWLKGTSEKRLLSAGGDSKTAFQI
jgi:plasmid maintenance system antidote protein VapI